MTTVLKYANRPPTETRNNLQLKKEQFQSASEDFINFEFLLIIIHIRLQPTEIHGFYVIKKFSTYQEIFPKPSEFIIRLRNLISYNTS